MGWFIEQEVSVGLQLVLKVQGPVWVVVVWYILFHKFLESLHLQGASNNFLVLKIKALKQLGSVMLYGVQLALGRRT